MELGREFSLKMVFCDQTDDIAKRCQSKYDILRMD
jgi:hypothetical protein